MTEIVYPYKVRHVQDETGAPISVKRIPSSKGVRIEIYDDVDNDNPLLIAFTVEQAKTFRDAISHIIREDIVCTCATIQCEDSSRHFSECPLRK